MLINFECISRQFIVGLEGVEAGHSPEQKEPLFIFEGVSNCEEVVTELAIRRPLAYCSHPYSLDVGITYIMKRTIHWLKLINRQCVFCGVTVRVLDINQLLWLVRAHASYKIRQSSFPVRILTCFIFISQQASM
jgi:hypothetical protein